MHAGVIDWGFLFCSCLEQFRLSLPAFSRMIHVWYRSIFLYVHCFGPSVTWSSWFCQKHETQLQTNFQHPDWPKLLLLFHLRVVQRLTIYVRILRSNFSDRSISVRFLHLKICWLLLPFEPPTIGWISVFRMLNKQGYWGENRDPTQILCGWDYVKRIPFGIDPFITYPKRSLRPPIGKSGWSDIRNLISSWVDSSIDAEDSSMATNCLQQNDGVYGHLL